MLPLIHSSTFVSTLRSARSFFCIQGPAVLIALFAASCVGLLAAPTIRAQTLVPGRDLPADMLAGVRFRAFEPSTEAEIFLGVPNLDETGNRTEQQYEWLTSQPFNVSYDGDLTLSVRVGGNEALTYSLAMPLEGANYLEINVTTDAGSSVAPALEDVILRSADLGDLSGATGSTIYWHVGGVDLSTAWSVTGIIVLPAPPPEPPLVRSDRAANGISSSQIELLVGGISNIVVEKATNPPTAPGTFTFHGDIDGSIVAGERLSVQVASGLYTTNETNLPQGFIVDEIFCNDVDSAGNVTTGSATFNVAVGETVTCLFTNEQPGVIIEESDGVSAITEGAISGPDRQAGYDVTLRSRPEAPVRISVLPDNQLSVDKTVLTFTPDDWSIPQRVLVVASDDDFDELTPHPGVVDHRVSSTDPRYDDIDEGYRTPFVNMGGTDLTPRTVDVTITDDDEAAVRIDEPGPGTPLQEGTPQVRFYTLTLDSRPRNTVTLTLSADSQVTVDPTSIVIPSDAWFLPRPVMATVTDDSLIEGPHSGDITHSVASDDPQYDAAAVFVNTSQVPAPQPNILRIPIQDDDVAGVMLTPMSLNVLEGGSDSYEMALTAQPVAEVTVGLTPDSQVAANVDSLSFSPANWMTPQRVIVTALDDNDAEGPHAGSILHATQSTDSAFQNLPPVALAVAIADDDSPSVLVAPSVLELVEGGDATAYEVDLTTRPAAEVLIEFTLDDQVTLDREVLRFTPANWNQPQRVRATAIDDAIDESTAPATHGGTISHSVASEDPQYNSLPAAGVAVRIEDNDSAKVQVTDRELAITESGNEAGYLLRLATEPTALVEITARFDAAQVRLTPAIVRFDANNWDEPQLVIVHAIDDAVDEGNHFAIILHEARSADSRYDARPIDAVAAEIMDNDRAGVSIAPTSLSVSERGKRDQYTIVLESEPLALVTVEIEADDEVETDARTVTFDSSNWDQPQPVVVSAVNDGVQESKPGEAHRGVLRHVVRSEDSLYADIDAADVDVAVFDNDDPSTIWLPLIVVE